MKIGWTSRLHGLGAHHASELAWSQVWSLLARDLRLHGLDRARERLWQLRFASWVLALDADPRTCRQCGAEIDHDASVRAAYCSTACRKAAHRSRAAEEPSPWEATVGDARRDLAELRAEAALGERALRRWQRDRVPLDPPDWTTLEHVPLLPDPCSGGCAATCAHTQGPCLYARTRRPITDAPSEDDPHAR